MNGSVTPSVTGLRASILGASRATRSLLAASCGQRGAELRVVDLGAAASRRTCAVWRWRRATSWPWRVLCSIGSAAPALTVSVSGALRMSRTTLVLPEAERRRGDERHQADDDPDAELRQVLDEAQPVFMPDGSQRGRHRSQPPVSWTSAGSARGRCRPRAAPARPRDARATASTLRRSSSCIVVVTALVRTRDRLLELAHAGAELPAETRQALGAEDDEHDRQDDGDLQGSDVGHSASSRRVDGQPLLQPPDEVSGLDHIRMRQVRQRGGRCTWLS